MHDDGTEGRAELLQYRGGCGQMPPEVYVFRDILFVQEGTRALIATEDGCAVVAEAIQRGLEAENAQVCQAAAGVGLMSQTSLVHNAKEIQFP